MFCSLGTFWGRGCMFWCKKFYSHLVVLILYMVKNSFVWWPPDCTLKETILTNFFLFFSFFKIMCHSIVYLPICLFQALILNLPCYFSYRNRAMPLCITGVVCWFVSSSVMSFSDSRAAWYFLCRRPQTCTLSQQHISTLLPVPFPSVSSIWIPFFWLLLSASLTFSQMYLW